MKKIYLAAALAMTMGVSASAASFQAAKTAQQLVAGEMATVETVTSDMKKAPAKAPSAQELVGQSFGTNGYNNTQQGGWAPGGTYVESADGNNLLLRGWLLGMEVIKATYDAAEGTITIPAQDMNVEYQGEKLLLRFMDFDNKEYNSVPLKYSEEGISIKFGQSASDKDRQFVGPVFATTGEDLNKMFIITTASIWPEKKAYCFLTAINMQTIPAMCETLGTGLTGLFEYNAADWKANSGKAQFQDGWVLTGLTDQQVPAWDVEVMESVKNPGHVLLVNPYQGMPEEAKQFNEDTAAAGYILLDVSNPQCVLVQPLVYSGFMNWEQMGLGKAYMSNVCANSVYVGKQTKEEIIEEYLDFEMDLPVMDESYLVTIPDCCFGTSMDMIQASTWIDRDTREPVEMISNIQLPELTGVEGIVDDSVDAPARFFNLQGVEVAAPIKGEVTIVKKGNKSYKQIAK